MKHHLLACSLSAGLVLLSACDQQDSNYRLSLVDYDGFQHMTADVAGYRETRKLSPADFAAKSQEPGVMVLDTRSKAAYDQIHVKGAVHLNFSDFTKESLARVVPDKDTTILIYCNNNVDNGGPALVSKSAPLALNIPTFINLYGYGYKNIYELDALIEIDNQHIEWAGKQVANEKSPLAAVIY